MPATQLFRAVAFPGQRRGIDPGAIASECAIEGGGGLAILLQLEIEIAEMLVQPRQLRAAGRQRLEHARRFGDLTGLLVRLRQHDNSFGVVRPVDEEPRQHRDALFRVVGFEIEPTERQFGVK